MFVHDRSQHSWGTADRLCGRTPRTAGETPLRLGRGWAPTQQSTYEDQHLLIPGSAARASPGEAPAPPERRRATRCMFPRPLGPHAWPLPSPHGHLGSTSQSFLWCLLLRVHAWMSALTCLCVGSVSFCALPGPRPSADDSCGRCGPPEVAIVCAVLGYALCLRCCLGP